MANVFLQTPAPGPSVDLKPLFQSVSDDSCRKAMAEALAEYDQLNAIARDLAIPHMASATRDKLKERGINVPGDDETFRALYLERRDAQAMEASGFAIDDQIVSRLEKKATQILRRIKSKAIDELVKAAPVFPRSDAALAERLGLQQAVVWSPLHGIVTRALEDLRSELDRPIVLRNGANRRDVLESYFP